MKFTEERRDLFTLIGKDYVFAHCISADCVMGAGIAKEFARKYPGIKEYCLSAEPRVGDAVKFTGPNVVFNNVVFNLVTKNKYWHKPTYTSLRRTLMRLKEEMLDGGYTKLAMPRIGCGLDRLSWPLVKKMIIDVFEDTGIEVLVCVK